MSEELTTREKIMFTGYGLVGLTALTLLGRFFYKKIMAGSEQRKSFDENSPASIAKRIKMAFENDGWFGTNVPELRNALQEIKSKEQFEASMKSYQKMYNSSMLRDMQDELQSSEYAEMQSIIAAKPGKGVDQSARYQQWARRLKAAFDKTYGFLPGTDEEAIRAVFTEIPSQDDFVKTSTAYENIYGRTLIADLKSELEMWEYGGFMSIITNKPKQINGSIK